ncbi:PE family protein, partial [Mycobacterium simiae]
MSFVSVTPEIVATAATELAGIGSAIGDATAAAAAPTTAAAAAAAD